MPTFPFEVSLEEILQYPESYVDAVFSCLESEFLVMPKGAGFVEYVLFERGYEVLKMATAGFSRLNLSTVFPVTVSEPISIIQSDWRIVSKSCSTIITVFPLFTSSLRMLIM